jgi:hypothetical protein
MKKTILLFFLLLSIIWNSNAQNYNQIQSNNKVLHQKFDDVIYGDASLATHIRMSIYITKTEIDDPIYNTKYEFNIINHSWYQGNQTRIYISGIRTFANGILISGAFPEGFWSIIPFENSTVIFWYKTNETNLNFSLTWESIQYY